MNNTNSGVSQEHWDSTVVANLMNVYPHNTEITINGIHGHVWYKRGCDPYFRPYEQGRPPGNVDPARFGQYIRIRCTEGRKPYINIDEREWIDDDEFGDASTFQSVVPSVSNESENEGSDSEHQDEDDRTGSHAAKSNKNEVTRPFFIAKSLRINRNVSVFTDVSTIDNGISYLTKELRDMRSRLTRAVGDDEVILRLIEFGAASLKELEDRKLELTSPETEATKDQQGETEHSARADGSHGIMSESLGSVNTSPKKSEDRKLGAETEEQEAGKEEEEPKIEEQGPETENFNGQQIAALVNFKRMHPPGTRTECTFVEGKLCTLIQGHIWYAGLDGWPYLLQSLQPPSSPNKNSNLKAVRKLILRGDGTRQSFVEGIEWVDPSLFFDPCPKSTPLGSRQNNSGGQSDDRSQADMIQGRNLVSDKEERGANGLPNQPIDNDRDTHGKRDEQKRANVTQGNASASANGSRDSNDTPVASNRTGSTNVDKSDVSSSQPSILGRGKNKKRRRRSEQSELLDESEQEGRSPPKKKRRKERIVSRKDYTIQNLAEHGSDVNLVTREIEFLQGAVHELVGDTDNVKKGSEMQILIQQWRNNALQSLDSLVDHRHATIEKKYAERCDSSETDEESSVEDDTQTKNTTDSATENMVGSSNGSVHRTQDTTLQQDSNTADRTQNSERSVTSQNATGSTTGVSNQKATVQEDKPTQQNQDTTNSSSETGRENPTDARNQTGRQLFEAENSDSPGSSSTDSDPTPSFKPSSVPDKDKLRGEFHISLRPLATRTATPRTNNQPKTDSEEQTEVLQSVTTTGKSAKSATDTDPTEAKP